MNKMCFKFKLQPKRKCIKYENTAQYFDNLVRLHCFRNKNVPSFGIHLFPINS